MKLTIANQVIQVWSRSELRRRGIGEPTFWSGNRQADDLLARADVLLLNRGSLEALSVLDEAISVVGARWRAKCCELFRATCEHRAGIALAYARRANQAQQLLLRARRRFVNCLGEDSDSARVDMDLAHMHIALLAPDLAGRHLDRAWREFERYDFNGLGEAMFLVEAGAIYAALDERDLARELFERAARVLWAFGTGRDVLRTQLVTELALREPADDPVCHPGSQTLWNADEGTLIGRHYGRRVVGVPAVQFT